MKKQIAQGAEAKIFETSNSILKERTKKSYRLSELDDKLRIFRTKREAKIIEKIRKLGINVPKILNIDKENAVLEMEKINGELLKNVLKKDYKKLSYEIGKIVGKLHKNNIIHGDLTTSNMILKDKKIYLIDFGLSFVSTREEDKAVDLHLLKQALESKHYKIFEECFKEVLRGYKKENPEEEHVLDRLIHVEKRGRNKNKQKNNEEKL